MKSLYESILDTDKDVIKQSEIISNATNILKEIAVKIKDIIHHTTIKQLDGKIVYKNGTYNIYYTYSDVYDRMSIIEELYVDKNIKELVKNKTIDFEMIRTSDTIVLNFIDKEILKQYNTKEFYIEIDPDTHPKIRIGAYGCQQLGEIFMNYLLLNK